MESGDWLHEGQRWVPALLRGADVQPPASDGQEALQERFSPCAARGRVDHPVRLALTSPDLRQLDERPVPKGRAALVHPAGLQGDDGLPASHIPNPDEAPRDCGRARQSTQLAEERVAWNQRREREGRFAHSKSSEHSRSHKVPLGRASTWTDSAPTPDRHSLDHRRRRVRTGVPTDGSRLGENNSQPLLGTWRAVLLQAVGRREQEEIGSDVRRPHLE